MSAPPDRRAEREPPLHTLLVVDDDPANLRLVSSYLKNAGFRILVSRDGESALKRARYAQPDLILMDVVMPGMDGFETSRQLQADETLRHIPVIFMTALINVDDKVKGFQLGAVDYIPKPMQHEELLGRITAHLRLRDLTAELRAAKENLERQVEQRTAELARSNEELRLEIAERKQVEHTLRRYAERLEGLRQVGLELAAQLDLSTLLHSIVTTAVKLIDGTAGGLYLYQPVRNALELMVATGIEQPIVGNTLQSDEGLAGKVWETGEPLAVEDYRNWAGRVTHNDEFGLRGMLGVPIHWGAQRLGVLVVWTGTPHVFSQSDMQILHLFASQAAVAIENARLFEAEREQRRQVEQSQVQLVRSEKLAATGRLAASLAHEINNPLQIIHNSLQLLLTLPFGPDKRQEYLQMADDEVERLMGIVTRILDFARPPRQKMQPTDVNRTIEKALALTSKYLQHNHITLRQGLSPDLPPVVAAPDELGQVFLNLVLNAVDAMPQGGTLQITSRLGDDGRLAVAFADTGPGIPPDHLERIFEPFFSTKEGGTGLGLSISYDVVERHEGKITVESTVGEGTTFTVWLPVTAD